MMPDSKGCLKKLLEWVQDHVDKKSEDFSGHKPCPYAASAIEEGRVLFHVIDKLEYITRVKSIEPQNELSHVFLFTGFRDYPLSEIVTYIEHQNENHFGYWLMYFDPRAPRIEDVWKNFVKEDEDDSFGLFLLQSLEDITDASAKLSASGYYNKADDDDIYFFHQREELAHAWNEIQTRFIQSKEEQTN